MNVNVFTAAARSGRWPRARSVALTLFKPSRRSRHSFCRRCCWWCTERLMRLAGGWPRTSCSSAVATSVWLQRAEQDPQRRVSVSNYVCKGMIPAFAYVVRPFTVSQRCLMNVPHSRWKQRRRSTCAQKQSMAISVGHTTKDAAHVCGIKVCE